MLVLGEWCHFRTWTQRLTFEHWDEPMIWNTWLNPWLITLMIQTCSMNKWNFVWNWPSKSSLKCFFKIDWRRSNWFQFHRNPTKTQIWGGNLLRFHTAKFYDNQTLHLHGPQLQQYYSKAVVKRLAWIHISFLFRFLDKRMNLILFIFFLCVVYIRLVATIDVLLHIGCLFWTYGAHMCQHYHIF